MSGVTAPPSPRPSSCPLPQASLVHTTETIRIRYFMDLLVEKSWPVMLVGNAGTGKSVLMGDKLDSLSTDDYLVQAVPFNFYTTSAMLQGEVEDKRGSSRPGLDIPNHSHLTRATAPQSHPDVPHSAFLLQTRELASCLSTSRAPTRCSLCPEQGDEGGRSHRELRS